MWFSPGSYITATATFASALRTWFIDKMHAVTHSLGDRAYLILSGVIKQSTMGFANCDMMNYEEIAMMVFILFRGKSIALILHICISFSERLHFPHNAWVLSTSSKLFWFVLITAVSGILCQQKGRFDGAVGKTTLSQADLEVGCISFSYPQCEWIIVWAVPVRNDNRGWHWKVPEFSCLKMSLGWLRQNTAQGDGRRILL